MSGGPPQYQRFVSTTIFLAVVVGTFLALLLPWVHRRRRHRAQRDLQEKTMAAIVQILADGKVDGPKGPYVPHRRSGVKTKLWPSNETRPPKASGYHGMPWP